MAHSHLGNFQPKARNEKSADQVPGGEDRDILCAPGPIVNCHYTPKAAPCKGFAALSVQKKAIEIRMNFPREAGEFSALGALRSHL